MTFSCQDNTSATPKRQGSQTSDFVVGFGDEECENFLLGNPLRIKVYTPFRVNTCELVSNSKNHSFYKNKIFPTNKTLEETKFFTQRAYTRQTSFFFCFRSLYRCFVCFFAFSRTPLSKSNWKIYLRCSPAFVDYQAPTFQK